MEEITGGSAKSGTIAVIAVAVAALVVGYFVGLSQGKKTATPAESPKAVNPFDEKEIANPLENVKNPFEDVDTNPFK